MGANRIGMPDPFAPGARVVCTNARVHDFTGEPSGLTLGSTYTVESASRLSIGPGGGLKPCVRLNEIAGTFDASRFRAAPADEDANVYAWGAGFIP